MSDGQAFDPSLLEGKDRNELVAIASSLGKKPPARAKKADIITLIMELVGAEAPAADPPAADPSADGAPEAAGTPEPEEPADEPAAAAETPSEAPEPEERGRSGGRGDQGGRADQGGRNGQGNQDQGARDQGGRTGGDGQANGDRAEPGNQAEPQQPQPEEGEGNRRRRRRGRDRNRNHDDEQVNAEPVDVEGFVDLRDEGYGFLRVAGYLPSPNDAYISVKQVRQFGLRKGDVVAGRSRAANRNEKNPALIQLDSVNGVAVSGQPTERPEFEKLTPLYPDVHLRLEQPEFPENMTARIIDLLAPIGKGQRGLIVSPPKAGKTTVVKDIVRAVERNHPEVHVIVLLVDERPEEVTDLRRWVLNGEVAASTFDRPTEEHIALAELVIERAKRLVEQGKDVMVVLDGITRLTRAYNLNAPANGRTMAGGMDSSALYPPKKFFGAARNVEEGGSLTILATALVETNTRLDEVIFEEFKGTGNMELRLDRRLAERRVFPAIDVDGSSTRHEELLYPRAQLQQVYRLRRLLSDLKQEGGSGAAGLEMLVDRLRTVRTNEAFLAEIAKATS
ncbi:MAG: transcription termination factor Rho [Actinobacteria bacterium]|nr:transcription termination factor Rho [Actinomycetota bacterium]